jgi:hypothetical protein
MCNVLQDCLNLGKLKSLLKTAWKVGLNFSFIAGYYARTHVVSRLGVGSAKACFLSHAAADVKALHHPRQQLKSALGLQYWRHQGGFSLAETALALFVLAMISSAILSTLSAYRHAQAITMTKTHQERIAYALAAYAVSHGFSLPCPGAGVESGVAQSDAASGCKVVEGIVPFQTLGLPESVAKDGFQRYFTYVVNQAYLVPQMGGEGHWHEPLGTLQIIRESAHEAMPSEAAFVLISHGYHGHGAFLSAAATRRIMTAYASDRESGNIDVMPQNGIYRYYDNAFTPNSRQRFDQIIFWVSWQELISFYGKARIPGPHPAPKPLANMIGKEVVDLFKGPDEGPIEMHHSESTYPQEGTYE